jgi:hypothetical protein
VDGTTILERFKQAKAQQQGADPQPLPALIPSQAPHPKTRDRIGRQRSCIRRLQIGQPDLRRSQGVKPGDLCRCIRRHQHKGLAYPAAHVLVGLLLQEAIQGRDPAGEGLAVVVGRVELLLVKHGSRGCGPAPAPPAVLGWAQTVG